LEVAAKGSNKALQIATLSQKPSNRCDIISSSFINAQTQFFFLFDSKTRFNMFLVLQVGYEVGCGGNRLPEFCASDFDEKLIPVIHSAPAPTCGRPLIIELIFHILHPSTTALEALSIAPPSG